VSLVPRPNLRDFTPESSSLLEEVLNGLQKRGKELPCKLFYDEHGSDLFDQITQLEEYYPTRTETAIMQDNIAEIVGLLGPRVVLIEYGSGNSEKTTILLDHLESPAAYIPIDIARESLTRSAKRIAARYPRIDVIPVWADYNDSSFRIPLRSEAGERRVVYFPGSTIGNFHPSDALLFIERMKRVCGPQGAILIGVDLKKDPLILHRAYNDRLGVTAEFNLNILRRINREFDSSFDLSAFKHRAIYNQKLGRIEMHLVSIVDQTVDIGGETIHFAAGETIWTESSYKYSLDEFRVLALDAGLNVLSVWKDHDSLFSVQYLAPSS
jgi:dimethylhistidine N-methyltransferase